jgi:tRNA(Ile2)-agmatinylcytidine synthase
MVLWIGVDDTDSLQGMCTTFLATEIVRDLTADFDLIGYPRLVRLNPNIPWKTRGNGAVCLRIGNGEGLPRVVGVVSGRPILSYPQGRSPRSATEVIHRVARLVERWSRFDDPSTNPAFAVLRRQPTPALYWKAVRGIVSLREARATARGLGTVRAYKNGRGSIGALASIAWRPRDRTFEILTYRPETSWGTPRIIVPESVVRMDRLFSSTFNNYDVPNRRVVIAPHSPCPILFGIRGDDPKSLPPAGQLILGEKPERWIIFETNQGTDDHVSPDQDLQPRTTHRVRGEVTSVPHTLTGGHVVFGLGEIDVTAYEPSKQFRGVVRSLLVGDRVEAIGAIRESPRTLNLEKILVEELAPATRKIANPWCARCHKRAKSLGRSAGYRCARCGRRFPGPPSFLRVERNLQPGWYEPPVGSRRHLSKPLKRMGVGSSD